MSDEPKVELNHVDRLIAYHRRQMEMERERVEFLESKRSVLEKLPAISTFIGPTIDFDRLEHKDTVKVIRGLGGKWKKTPGEGQTIHYEATIDGKTYRIWNGAPPPSCKIIEVEEHVPEIIIPASVRKVRKLVCHPEVSAVIATAREKGLAEQASSDSV